MVGRRCIMNPFKKYAIHLNKFNGNIVCLHQLQMKSYSMARKINNQLLKFKIVYLKGF